MPPNLIGYHIAACHLELPSDPNSEPYKYSCDGNAIDADMACCRLDQVYETLAVNDYVEHMKKHHPAQVNAPFSFPSRPTYRIVPIIGDFIPESV